jgi:L-ribulose-5-phosphate 4-epimerase
VTADLTPAEIAADYERNTGVAICRLFNRLTANSVPAALVAGHAPFCWGSTPADASHNAVILESVARMACYTVTIAPQAVPLARELHDKHFLRKHGSTAYYGQPKSTQ